MRKIDLVISNDAPNAKDVAWLKPVNGGFSLKVMDGGVWKDVNTGSDGNSLNGSEALENLKSELIGSVQDKKTANTINGAKALAKEVQKKVDALSAKGTVE